MTDLCEVIKWLCGEDTGRSSRAIALHMTTGICDGSFPWDPSDLGRCLRLLEQFPEWKTRLPEMAVYGPKWRALVSQWDELASSMEEEVGIDWSKGRSASKTYVMMRQIMRETNQ